MNLNKLALSMSVAVSASLVMSVGCKSKSDKESASINVTENATSSNTLTPASSGKPQIAAFVKSSDSSHIAFEQGAQLAIGSSTPPVFELSFYEGSEGDSVDAPVLKSVIEKNKSPLVLYWSVDDISLVSSLIRNSESVGMVTAEVNKKLIPLGASIYGFGYSTELTFKQLAKFTGQTLKSYRFGVVSSLEPNSDLKSKIFIEESKSLGNTIVFEEKIGDNEKDFSSLISRALKEKCDTIFAVLPTASMIEFVRAVRKNQFKGKVITGDTLYASDIASLGADAEGIYMVQAWSDDPNLSSLYVSRYGRPTDNITLGFVALGFDIVNCLSGVGVPFDAYSIKNALFSKSCEGLTGKTQFTGERVAQRRKQILTIRGGEIKKVE